VAGRNLFQSEIYEPKSAAETNGIDYETLAVSEIVGARNATSDILRGRRTFRNGNVCDTNAAWSMRLYQLRSHSHYLDRETLRKLR